MKRIPLLRVCAFLPFVEFLRSLGAPVERLLSTAKLPDWMLDDPEVLMPLHPALMFIERAARREGLESLGLIVGQRTPVHRLGAFGSLLNESLTLYDALQMATRMSGSLNYSLRMWLERHEGQLWFKYQRLSCEGIAAAQTNQYVVTLALALIRQAAGQDWKPDEIHWQLPKSSPVERHQFFTESHLHFGQPSNAVVLPMALASRPLAVSGIVDGRQPGDAVERLLATAPAQDFAGSLEQLLRLQLKHQPPNLIRSAEMAGLSPRTLQRRLREEQCKFSRLCEKVRFEWTVELLREPNIRLTDIAHELGYSDSANFNRAFRRWTGISPSEFRRQALEPNQKFDPLHGAI